MISTKLKEKIYYKSIELRQEGSPGSLSIEIVSQFSKLTVTVKVLLLKNILENRILFMNNWLKFSAIIKFNKFGMLLLFGLKV